ncbi:MAG: ORF6N domain-containing protein [Deltaproteobacteria bacterium]|nr:ORF6N domain-containing protein [Deltaproteobacteria bacterium]
MPHTVPGDSPGDSPYQAVRRNLEKFPSDFMFRLSLAEARKLNRSQTVIGSQKHRNPRYVPYAFTEHGAIMAANVLNSPRAVQMSVFVVRAFVRLRQMIATHKDIVAKLVELERKVASHDTHIRSLFDAIRQLMTPPAPKKRKIGFLVREKAARYGRG